MSRINSSSNVLGVGLSFFVATSLVTSGGAAEGEAAEFETTNVRIPMVNEALVWLEFDNETD